MKSKKKVIDVSNGSFLNLLEGAIVFLISLKGEICKKILGNPDLDFHKRSIKVKNKKGYNKQLFFMIFS